MSKDGWAPPRENMAQSSSRPGQRREPWGVSTGGDDGVSSWSGILFPTGAPSPPRHFSLWLTHSFKQYLLSTNYGPDFVDIKQIRHKIPSRFQAQSHGDDFSNLACIEHLLYTSHCSRCFAGVYNSFLPPTQKGAFNSPILPTRKPRHGEDY